MHRSLWIVVGFSYKSGLNGPPKVPVALELCKRENRFNLRDLHGEFEVGFL